MTYVQKLSGEFNITDPDWPKYSLRTVVTSDSFDRSGALSGSYTDAALGGQPAAWTSTGTNGWAIENGGLRSPSTIGAAASLSGMPTNVSVSLKIREMVGPPASNYFVVSIRSNANRSTRIGLNVGTNGSGYLRELVGNAEVQRSSFGDGTFKVGDTLTIRANGANVNVLANGVLVAAMTVQVQELDTLALTHQNGSGVFLLDDLKIVS